MISAECSSHKKQPQRPRQQRATTKIPHSLLVDEPEEKWGVEEENRAGEKMQPVLEEGRGEQVSLSRRSGEVQQLESPPGEQVQEVAKELPVLEAVAMEPTVTTFKPAEVRKGGEATTTMEPMVTTFKPAEVRKGGEATTTVALIIREEIGETTVAMEQVKNEQLADMLTTFKST